LQDDEEDFSASINLNDYNLIKLINSNPVSAASFFKKTLEAFYDIVLGKKLDRCSKRTVPLGSRKKGIFGKLTAGFHAIETSAKKALHGHFLFWGVLPTEYFQQAAAFRESVNALSTVMEKMFMNDLPDSKHVEDMARILTVPSEREPFVPKRYTYRTCPLMSKNAAGYWNRICGICSRSGIHSHVATCRKPPGGKCGCRMAYSKAIQPKTTVVQLSAHDGHARVGGEKYDDMMRGEYYITDQLNIGHFDVNQDRSKVPYFENPFPKHDGRLLVWEFKRPLVDLDKLDIHEDTILAALAGRGDGEEEILFDNFFENKTDDPVKKFKYACLKLGNSNAVQKAIEWLQHRNMAVVQVTPLATGLLACNTNSVFLGATEDAKPALYYIIKYVSKDCTELASCLSVLQYAIDLKRKYPSSARDADTDLRSGKYLLQIMLNKMIGMREIADTQAAAVLLGFPSQDSTAKPTYVFIKNAIAAVRQRQIEDCMENGQPGDAWMDTESQFGSGLSNLTTAAQDICAEDSNAPSCSHIFPKSAMDADDSILITGEEKDIQKGWGSAPIYKLMQADGSEMSIAVPQDIDYAFRGDALRSLSLVEYPCIIEVILKPISKGKKGECCKESDTDSGDELQSSTLHKTKVRNTLFPFQRYHPLAKTHVQRIRSKLYIPCLAGDPPPTMQPFDTPGYTFSAMARKEQAKVREAARYSLEAAR
jgi:hypothetical protein